MSSSNQTNQPRLYGEHPARAAWLAGMALLLVLAVAACSPVPAQPTTEAQAATTPAATVDTQLAFIHQAWESSPHAQTYDLSKGPNTYCARCHSPQNWDPAATVDPPPNCVTCKFPTDQEVRVAQGNPLVPQGEWQNIGCEICHAVQDGAIQPGFSWLDTPSGFHETVSTPTELCEACHTDTETLRHRRDLGEAAHAGFTCVDCHDPHSTAASCTSAGCHPAQAERTAAAPGHDAAHVEVACVACHDAAGLAVAPQEAGAAWMTLRTNFLLGRETTDVYQSHALQRAVDCQRCHVEGNTWGLSVLAGNELP